MDDVAFFRPTGGMNGAGDPAAVSQQQYRRATNVTLKDGLPTTRPGVRLYAFQSDDIAADFVRANNHQGAAFFNPAKGQGGLILGKDDSQTVFANGGRKFVLHLEGDFGATVAKVKEITNGHFASSLLHLVWWCVAENYAIATDGLASTLIYDANTGELEASSGYDSVNKEESKFPNGATVCVYAHARLLPVINARQILASDSLHKVDQSSASNLLGFTDQTYWNTGQYFLPPSAMGNITAGAILPLRNTQHGHGEVIFHCWDGVFSLNTNISPRATWSTEALTKHVLLDAGAVGPYAVAMWDGDQIYRTRHGVTTLRSAAANDNVEGNPQTPLSEPVETFFRADVPEWLRFCSVATWTEQKRFLCTVEPCVDGRFRWHRGVVVRNFAPVPAERGSACWEGLWTLPGQGAGIIQLVSGLYPRERLTAFVIGTDGVNRLAEFTGDLQDDILEDGSRQRIRCQLLSRAMDFTQPFLKKQFLLGTLFVKNARGKVDWGVWVRIHGKSEFVFWRGGVIEVPQAADALGLQAAEPFSGPIALGDLPRECATGFRSAISMQFLIRWKGFMQVESLRVQADAGDSEAEKFDTEKLHILKNDPLAGGYDDYEYCGEAEWEITKL